jgi:hypothetical protein
VVLDEFLNFLGAEHGYWGGIRYGVGEGESSPSGWTETAVNSRFPPLSSVTGPLGGHYGSVDSPESLPIPPPQSS